MASIVTGLFQSQSQSRKIAKDLENIGLPSQDYIIYLHEHHVPKEVKTSILQSFFQDDTTLEDDSLVVTARVRDPEKRQQIMQQFENNHAIYVNYFENIKFQDVMSLKFLQKMVSLRAKSQIYNSREVRHHEGSSGMTSEINFGRA